jgi:hypothetical protein
MMVCSANHAAFDYSNQKANRPSSLPRRKPTLFHAAYLMFQIAELSIFKKMQRKENIINIQ